MLGKIEFVFCICSLPLSKKMGLNNSKSVVYNVIFVYNAIFGVDEMMHMIDLRLRHFQPKQKLIIFTYIYGAHPNMFHNGGWIGLPYVPKLTINKHYTKIKVNSQYDLCTRYRSLIRYKKYLTIIHHKDNNFTINNCEKTITVSVPYELFYNYRLFVLSACAFDEKCTLNTLPKDVLKIIIMML